MSVQDMFIKVWSFDGSGDFEQGGRILKMRFCFFCKTMKPKQGEQASAPRFVCVDCNTQDEDASES